MERTIYEEIIGGIEDTNINEFAIYPHTIYMDAKNVGLASTSNIDFCKGFSRAGSIHRYTTSDLAQMFKSKILIESAIGLAAVNASLNYDILIEKAEDINAYKILLDRGKDKNISVIGHFPFVKRLKKECNCKNLWVFELHKKDKSDLLPNDYSKYIPRSDIVMISGTTLINKTFGEIYKFLNKSFNIILGPSTPLSNVLFNYKIDAICGTVVIDKALAKQYLSQGAKYREAKGIKFVTLFKG